jgi:hypothetical protein
VIRGKDYGLSRIGGSTFRTDAKKALLSQFPFRVNERFLYETLSQWYPEMQETSDAKAA